MAKGNSKNTAEPNDKAIRWLANFHGARLLLPKKFAPDTEFLKRHAEECPCGQGVINE
jgi:hypothetical protein